MPVRDVVTWTAMITAYVKRGDHKEGLELFKGMKGIRTKSSPSNGNGKLCQNPNKISIEHGDIKPNEFTYASILPSIAGLREIEEGRRMHNEVIRRNLEFDVFVASGLVVMYAKCGWIEDARKVFDKMSQRDLVLWNAMIEGKQRNDHYYLKEISCGDEIEGKYNRILLKRYQEAINHSQMQTG